jgi:hypothetical protein
MHALWACPGKVGGGGAVHASLSLAARMHREKCVAYAVFLPHAKHEIGFFYVKSMLYL